VKLQSHVASKTLFQGGKLQSTLGRETNTKSNTAAGVCGNFLVSMYHKNVLACLGCSLEAFVLLFCLFQAFPKRKQQAILSNLISLC